MSEPNGEPVDDAVDFVYELGERDIAFTIDEDLYALDAIYGACYLFVDRCYVLLARPADRKVHVRLKAKQAESAEALEAMAGEFANELLNQVLRVRVGRATAAIREHYMARAFFAHTPQSNTIAELLAELDAEELEEDDLEIPVPWNKTAAPAEAGSEGEKAVEAPAAEEAAGKTGEQLEARDG
jgi:His-Xaa-Ser system protein HxsD